MRLRYSPSSPYVRKVLVVAIETGLDGRIERLPTDIQAPSPDFLADNPLGKVPALTTDDGTTLFDSRVICEYLDSLHGGPRLFAAEGPARWRMLRVMALADGILDAGVLRLVETRRPERERSAVWMERQREKVSRGLDALAREVTHFEGTASIGHIAAGCCLGWLEFRFCKEEDWRIGRAILADWYSMFMTRPSMVATVPKDAG